MGLAAALAVGASGCATYRGVPPGQARDDGRGTYKIGQPYTVMGQSYVPHEDYQHRETGQASWYGPGFHGRQTANGEIFDENAMTVAHRTLPMPSIVRVTNLDNGRSIVARVNDRGPFSRSRVLDVSRAAARELDMLGTGTANVRVEIMEQASRIVKDVALNGGGPAEQLAALAQAGRAPDLAGAPPAPIPPQEPAPPAPVVAALPPPAQTRPRVATQVPGARGAPRTAYYVQAGAFSTPENAERMQARVAAFGSSMVTQVSLQGQDVYRVRIGPLADPSSANEVLSQMHQAGYRDARVVSD